MTTIQSQLAKVLFQPQSQFISLVFQLQRVVHGGHVLPPHALAERDLRQDRGRAVGREGDRGGHRGPEGEHQLQAQGEEGDQKRNVKNLEIPAEISAKQRNALGKYGDPNKSFWLPLCLSVEYLLLWDKIRESFTLLCIFSSSR